MESVDFKIFENHNIGVMGPSGSGKTRATKRILQHLMPLTRRTTIVSEMEEQNKMFKGWVYPCMIHLKFELDGAPPDNGDEKKRVINTRAFLNELWSYQKNLKSLHMNAHDNEVLEELFKHLSPSDKRLCEKSMHDLEAEFEKHRDYVVKLGRDRKESKDKQKANIKDLEKVLGESRAAVYRSHISKHVKTIRNLPPGKSKLSINAKLALDYFDADYRCNFVVDDMSEKLRLLFKDECLLQYCYKGRWPGIGLIYNCQDDSDIPPGARKQFHVIIFTSREIAKHYLGLKSNGFYYKENEIKEIVAEGFKGEEMRLVFFRIDPRKQFFYKMYVPIDIDPPIVPHGGPLKQIQDEIDRRTDSVGAIGVDSKYLMQ